MNTKTKKQHWYKSPWLIGWLLLVLVVVAVNAYMITQSINDFPGLVVDDFYDRGQDYEENIVTKLENNQKWTTEFNINEIYIGQETIIDFKLQDKDGKTANIEKLTLFAYRPSDAKKDFSVVMLPMPNKIDYQAKITFPDKGKWDLLASAVIDGIEVNYAQSIFVKD